MTTRSNDVFLRRGGREKQGGRGQAAAATSAAGDGGAPAKPKLKSRLNGLKEATSHSTSRYQDIQLPKPGLREIGQPSDARGVRDVQLVEDDVGEPQASELPDGSCAPRLVPGRQDNDDGEAAGGGGG
jgi:hypothetical protein